MLDDTSTTTTATTTTTTTITTTHTKFEALFAGMDANEKLIEGQVKTLFDAHAKQQKEIDARLLYMPWVILFIHTSVL